VKSVPLIIISPTSGLSKRFTVLIKVLFPAPEKPLIPTISPFSTVRLTLSKALKDCFFLMKCLGYIFYFYRFSELFLNKKGSTTDYRQIYFLWICQFK